MQTTYRSLRSNLITQKFGNPGDMYTEMKMLGHNGVDFWALDKEPIYYDREGGINTIYWCGTDDKGGIGVEVLRKTENGNTKERFWHFKEFCVYKGQEIKFGDLIGYADNTGLSTGTHEHRDRKNCDPDGKTLNSDNGYKGCIYFIDDFKNVFVQDIIELRKLPSGYSFEKDMDLGETSPKVLVMKRILQNELAFLPQWSLTNYFGTLTKDAVHKFQYKYKTEIDKAAGYTTHCTGKVGIGTRTVINRLLKEYLS